MPYGDGTGPDGRGPRGRRMGPCGRGIYPFNGYSGGYADYGPRGYYEPPMGYPRRTYLGRFFTRLFGSFRRYGRGYRRGRRGRRW
ncbi:hypothetical protein [Aciduliprofundum sp. MAR08-339]|uniref:hypothetical protein n=1 Tax=Aciduliprofundum sp. (strain MAR08-339) TaxID=673860 RepID=UPI00064FBE7B